MYFKNVIKYNYIMCKIDDINYNDIRKNDIEDEKDENENESNACEDVLISNGIMEVDEINTDLDNNEKENLKTKEEEYTELLSSIDIRNEKETTEELNNLLEKLKDGKIDGLIDYYKKKLDGIDSVIDVIKDKNNSIQELKTELVKMEYEAVKVDEIFNNITKKVKGEDLVEGMRIELKIELLNDFFKQIEQNEQDSKRKKLILFYKQIKDSLMRLKWKLLTHDYRKCILLRGNPGIGKTSFIIYLLRKLKDFKVDDIETSENLSINLYKNTQSDDKKVEYRYSNGILSEPTTDSSKSVDVVITDSYDFSIVGKNPLLAIYISSPDENNYKNYIEYKKNNKGDCLDLYLDVFSDKEIEEWKELCLPPNLKDYITKDQIAEGYGNIPRHIYFDSVYKTYYNRNYWREIYRKGINMVISNLGFIEVVSKYLFKNEIVEDKINGITADKISNLKAFDIALSHFIVKYKYKNIFEINNKEMEFLSKGVIEYLLESIHHISTKDDIKAIKNVFFGDLYDKPGHPLYPLFFQDLIWYKCVNNTNYFGKKIIKIGKNKYNSFKELFSSNIYPINNCDYCMVDFKMYKNGDKLYLFNNCFIYIYYDNNNILNDNIKKKLNTYMKSLAGSIFKENNFLIILCHPEEAKENKSKPKTSESYNEIPLYNWIVSQKNYDDEFFFATDKKSTK